jgi:hypothetical protein
MQTGEWAVWASAVENAVAIGMMALALGAAVGGLSWLFLEPSGKQGKSGSLA